MSAFGDKFKAERAKQGSNGTFEFNGKQYTTKLAEESAPRKASPSRPSDAARTKSVDTSRGSPESRSLGSSKRILDSSEVDQNTLLPRGVGHNQGSSVRNEDGSLKYGN